MISDNILIVGYSGHSYVVIDIFNSVNKKVIGYYDSIRKDANPYSLEYFGSEKDSAALKKMGEYSYFVSIGDNKIRRSVIQFLSNSTQKEAANAIHKTSTVSPKASIGNGVMISNNSQINALSKIGHGVICNSGSIIEHECTIGNFSHIAPGAVLCGNVEIGENTLVGARSVIKEGIKVGSNVIIGAGTVVIKDVPDNYKIIGNPQRSIK